MFVDLPTRRRTQWRWATPLLALLMVGAYIWIFLLPDDAAWRATLLRWGTLSGSVTEWRVALRDERLLTLLTALFIHAGPVHLVGNLLFLLIFGLPSERTMGPWRTSSLWTEQYRSALQGLAQIAERVSMNWADIETGVLELVELRQSGGRPLSSMLDPTASQLHLAQRISPGDHEWETRAAKIDESFRSYVKWREFLYKATEVAQLQTSKTRDISVMNSVVRILKKAGFADKNVRDTLFGTGPGGGTLALRELIANHLQQKTFPIPAASGSRSRVGSKDELRAIMKVLTDGGFSGPN